MEINRSEIESNLVLNQLYFEEFSFCRTQDCSNDLKLKMGIESSIKSENDIHTVKLNVKLFDENDKFRLDVKTIGLFSLEIENLPDNVEYDEILKKNTLSIMFPYVRSQVSLLTTQPDLIPLIIPALNINNLIEKQHETS